MTRGPENQFRRHLLEEGERLFFGNNRKADKAVARAERRRLNPNPQLVTESISEVEQPISVLKATVIEIF